MSWSHLGKNRKKNASHNNFFFLQNKAVIIMLNFFCITDESTQTQLVLSDHQGNTPEALYSFHPLHHGPKCSIIGPYH